MVGVVVWRGAHAPGDLDGFAAGCGAGVEDAESGFEVEQ